MKKVLTLLALLISLGAFAQKKDTTNKKPDSLKAAGASGIIQPNNETPLLNYDDVIFLRDSVLANVPYKFAPILDQVFQYLQQRIQARAQEYMTKQAKKSK